MTIDQPPVEEGPNDHGKFSVNEDWIATMVGLTLVALTLIGAIPKGLIP